MLIYAGIDEAGYGPMFGPLVIGRAVLGVADLDASADPPPLWKRLAKAVCSDLTGRKGRIAVNDSKKLYTPAAGLRHLETGVLTFAALAGHRPASVDQWLDTIGELCHHDLSALPWYAPCPEQPWEPLPRCCTPQEIGIARNLLAMAAQTGHVQMLDLGAAVVLEDRFNRMAAATRSKASLSFTFVASHLQAIWQRYGLQGPQVVVDRQSGRMHYRELLAMTFPEARMTVLDETPTISRYRLEAGEASSPGDSGGATSKGTTSGGGDSGGGGRRMTVSFQVEAECEHMPVALASMISKYTRELLMARFQAWFTRRAPQVKPTAGYALDAKRFWGEIQPLLPGLGIDPERLRRSC